MIRFFLHHSNAFLSGIIRLKEVKALKSMHQALRKIPMAMVGMLDLSVCGAVWAIDKLAKRGEKVFSAMKDGCCSADNCCLENCACSKDNQP